MSKKRFWVSWICTEEDHRPMSYPPGEGVLGWWCSGYDGDGNSSMVALLEAENTDECRTIIEKDWPEFKGLPWRFIENRPEGWLPNDRFPLSDWMKERVA